MNKLLDQLKITIKFVSKYVPLTSINCNVKISGSIKQHNKFYLNYNKCYNCHDPILGSIKDHKKFSNHNLLNVTISMPKY